MVFTFSDIAKLFLKTRDMSFATRPLLTVSKHLLYNVQAERFRIAAPAREPLANQQLVERGGADVVADVAVRV